MRREDIELHSGGDECAAWLYRPEADEPHPIVVLAHGFGGVREARLWAYAERFAAAGIAALVFDYTHFGARGCSSPTGTAGGAEGSRGSCSTSSGNSTTGARRSRSRAASKGSTPSAW